MSPYPAPSPAPTPAPSSAPTLAPTFKSTIQSEMKVTGMTIETAQANEDVFVDTIATTANVEKSAVTVVITEEAARRLLAGRMLAEGDISVAYTIQVTAVQKAAVATTMAAATTAEMDAAIQVSATSHNVATAFAAIATTELAVVVTVEETASPTSAYLSSDSASKPVALFGALFAALAFLL